MAANLTNKGQEIAIAGDASPNGGIANLAVALRLFDGTSTPNKNGTGFNELPGVNGYTTGGWVISRSDWSLSLVGGDRRVTLGQRVLTATGPVSLVAGAYIVDSAGDVLGWWEMPALANLFAGDLVRINVFIQALPSA